MTNWQTWKRWLESRVNGTNNKRRSWKGCPLVVWSIVHSERDTIPLSPALSHAEKYKIYDFWRIMYKTSLRHFSSPSYHARHLLYIFRSLPVSMINKQQEHPFTLNSLLPSSAMCKFWALSWSEFTVFLTFCLIQLDLLLCYTCLLPAGPVPVSISSLMHINTHAHVLHLIPECYESLSPNSNPRNRYVRA